jgi:hypothetical protein
MEIQLNKVIFQFTIVEDIELSKCVISQPVRRIQVNPLFQDLINI